MTRPAWQRLKPAQQKAVASLAAKHGITNAASLSNISTTAVRRACAMTGIAPKRYERMTSKESRISTARALLRSLKLKPQDLL